MCFGRGARNAGGGDVSRVALATDTTEGAQGQKVEAETHWREWQEGLNTVLCYSFDAGLFTSLSHRIRMT